MPEPVDSTSLDPPAPSRIDRFCLALDCLRPRCAGEQTFALAELASFYDGQDGQTAVGEVLRRMPRSGGCGRRAGAAWLVTGPMPPVRPRAGPMGPEARE
jgi:hypothetical protein